MATERTMEPWHFWPFLALFCWRQQRQPCNDGRDYQGSGCADEGALASLGIPCCHARPRQLQQCVQRCVTMKCGNIVDGGALPCHPFLTLLRDGNNVSSANNALWMTVADNNGHRVGRWCLPSIVGHPLPACTTATTGAAWTNGGGVEDREALKGDK
jgi:hypothetical protein